MRRCGIILAFILTACSSQPSQSHFTMPAVPVFVAEVEREDVPLYFESLGQLKPSATVEVRPQVSGILREVHFDAGQEIKAGDRLFTVDPEPYLIKLQEVEAQMAQNKATLNSSKKKLERYSNLSKKDLISQQDWDELESQVMKNEAIVKADEAKVSSASRDLNHCIIRAPMDGRTGKVTYHPGNLISASQSTPLVTLYDYNDIVVEFTLTEREFNQLTDDHVNGSYPLEIHSFCNKKDKTSGTLTFLNNHFDSDTGLLLVQGKLSNEDQKYLPGQTVKVHLPLSVLHDVLAIPQKAVKINQQGPYVFVIKEDNTVEIRQLKLGEEFGDKVIVVDGLTQGEKVVTDGHLRLAPGLTVEIKQEEGKS